MSERKSIHEILSNGEVLIADGAMATSLYEKGFYINRSFEELCLTEPQSVKDIIRGFKSAGAQIFHTNTFNATLPKLTEYGLQDQLDLILKEATRLSREVAGHENYVLGLMGPLGVLVEPLGPTSLEEAESYFKTVAEVLDKTDIDGFAINGIHDFNELKSAIKAVRSVSQKPITVCAGFNENQKTSHGHTLKELTSIGEEFDLAAIGICGEVGPSAMLTALEALRAITQRPIIALPNAGLPRYVNNQYIYLSSPDYLGKFAKRFVQAGAQVVGGHCGVYDSHIKAMANAARMTQASASASRQKGSFQLPNSIHPIVDQPIEPSPYQERSNLGKALFEDKKPVTVELVPPTLSGLEKFIDRCKELDQAGVRFVNIPDGARAMARISPLHLSSYVKAQTRLEPIPHFVCRDRNLIGLQSDLLGAHVSDINNLLIVTGDPPKLGNNPGATAVYDVDAIGLTHIVSRMNQGLDIGGVKSGHSTGFLTGVALNPTAKNRELEIKRFRYKQEAGADFAITQPIYNLEAFKEFLDELGEVKIPIMIGVWPLVSLRNAEFLRNEVPGVDVPDWAVEEMKKAGDNKEEAIKRGSDIAIRTILEAKNLVRGFQISAPFNKAEIAISVINNIDFLKENLRT